MGSTKLEDDIALPEGCFVRDLIARELENLFSKTFSFSGRSPLKIKGYGVAKLRSCEI